jgi:hypothetical protein
MWDTNEMRKLISIYHPRYRVLILAEYPKFETHSS